MNSKNHLLYKILVIGILILFVGAGVVPSIGEDNNNNQDMLSLTFYTFDKTGTKECKVEISIDIAEKISCMFEELKYKITNDPASGETKSLKNDFVEMLDIYGLIPQGLSKDYVFSLLNPWWLRLNGNNPFTRYSFPCSRASTGRNDVIPAEFSQSGSAFFCSLAGSGRGLIFTPIIFPRPRLVTLWSAYSSAVSTAANLYTGHGFVAFGGQTGVALGFWGVGLSFAYPGEPAIFGFGGYALLTVVRADDVETYPLNQKPIISNENPLDGSVDVPLSLSELSFCISDADGDRMNYTVTTDPDIGSGNGQNKQDGVYKVPVIELQSNTEYSWHVIVSDGEDTTEKYFSFHTEIVAPIVSNPLPVDGDGWVSVDLSELSFRLRDLQGDLMDYTVETVPDIGSGSGSGVGDGTFTVDVGGLDYTTEYTWYVNVTDGEYWTREIFNFKTQPIMVFDPFDDGWMYRKEITIDHNMVDGDLKDFPVLINVVDPDLKNKAQIDGDDILFMDCSGVANRLFHEIEMYDDSNGDLVAWVKIPELDNNVDLVLYMYYGNPNCGSQQYPDKVWDSDYVGVWHILENGTGTRYDSTQNNNDGTPNGYEGDEATSNGKIDGADWFDGGNDYINCGDINDMEGVSQLSISAWFKADDISDIGTDYRAIVGKNKGDTSRTTIHIRYTAELYLLVGNGVNSYAYTSAGTISTGTWYHAVLVFNGSTTQNNRLKGYLNGLPLSFYYYSGNFPITTTTNSAFLGIGYDNQKDHFEGTIDEVRISHAARSAAWISTEYNNQNDPLNFLSFGPEESAP